MIRSIRDEGPLQPQEGTLIALKPAHPSIEHRATSMGHLTDCFVTETIAAKAEKVFGSVGSGVTWGLAYQKDRFNSSSTAHSLVTHTRAIFPSTFFRDYVSSDRETRRSANEKHAYYTQLFRAEQCKNVNYLLTIMASKKERTAGEIVAVRRLLSRLNIDCSSEMSIRKNLKKLMAASHPDKLVQSSNIFDALIQREQSRHFFDMAQLLKKVLFEQGDIKRVVLVPGGQQLDGHALLFFRTVFMVLLKLYCHSYCALMRPDLTKELGTRAFFAPLVPNVSSFVPSAYHAQRLKHYPSSSLRDYEASLAKEKRHTRLQTWENAFSVRSRRFIDDLQDPNLIRARRR